MEDLAGEKDVNGLTHLLSDVDEFQPRKVEELIPDKDILLDAYLIYPTGGYHPFYGVLNTLPRYQQKIWPCIKRIKYSDFWKSKEKLNDVLRKISLRENHSAEQLNPSLTDLYYHVTLQQNSFYIGNRYTEIKKNGKHMRSKKRGNLMQLMHRLVALAFIPNPENKPFVLHINDDSTNYLIENLKWGTQVENMQKTVRRRPGTVEQKYLDFVNKGIIKG